MYVDRFIRFYVKYFTPIIVLLFISTEFFSNVYVSYGINFLLALHMLILITSFIYHMRLHRVIKDDINKKILVVKTNTINDLKDPISMIALAPLEIPEDIATEDVNARVVFSGLKKFEFLHCVCRTIHSHNYYRYDWLKIDKTNSSDLINKLMVGDQILYHKEKSIVGKIIRFFSRCYWEHAAIYMGDGLLVEAVPGGVRKTHLSSWIECDDTDIGVLRAPGAEEKREEIISLCESMVGDQYNYRGVFNKFWMIITKKSCDGLMTPLVLMVNIALIFLTSFICYEYPDKVRIQIFIIFLISPYLFSSIYHWLAYNSEAVNNLKGLNEKS